MKHKKFHITGCSLITWDEILADLNERYYSHELYVAGQDGKTLCDNHDFNSTHIIELDPSERNWELVDALQIKERAAKMCNHTYKVVAHVYLSFTSKAMSHGKHIDIADVFHWQQAGKTDFMVWEDGKKYTYTLLPGDCVFIPAGMYHDTLPRSPRFGLSIGIFPTGYDDDATTEEIIAEFADKKDYTNVI